jgi:hypothetical protein
MISKINKKIQSIASSKQKEIIKLAIDELIEDHKKYGNCGCGYCYYKKKYVDNKLFLHRFQRRHVAEIGQVEKSTDHYYYLLKEINHNRELMRQYE